MPIDTNPFIALTRSVCLNPINLLSLSFLVLLFYVLGLSDPDLISSLHRYAIAKCLWSKLAISFAIQVCTTNTNANNNEGQAHLQGNNRQLNRVNVGEMVLTWLRRLKNTYIISVCAAVVEICLYYAIISMIDFYTEQLFMLLEKFYEIFEKLFVQNNAESLHELLYVDSDSVARVMYEHQQQYHGLWTVLLVLLVLSAALSVVGAMSDLLTYGLYFQQNNKDLKKQQNIEYQVNVYKILDKLYASYMSWDCLVAMAKIYFRYFLFTMLFQPITAAKYISEGYLFAFVEGQIEEREQNKRKRQERNNTVEEVVMEQTRQMMDRLQVNTNDEEVKQQMKVLASRVMNQIKEVIGKDQHIGKDNGLFVKKQEEKKYTRMVYHAKQNKITVVKSFHRN